MVDEKLPEKKLKSKEFRRETARTRLSTVFSTVIWLPLFYYLMLFIFEPSSEEFDPLSKLMDIGLILAVAFTFILMVYSYIALMYQQKKISLLNEVSKKGDNKVYIKGLIDRSKTTSAPYALLWLKNIIIEENTKQRMEREKRKEKK